MGLAVDLALTAVTMAACGYVVVNYERIMTELPWAKGLDMALTAGLVLAVLELGRRTVGLIFPVLVCLGLGYALFGNLLPGPLRHRGFGVDFVTETIFLGDLGIWGMLTGVAATVIAAAPKTTKLISRVQVSAVAALPAPPMSFSIHSWSFLE